MKLSTRLLSFFLTAPAVILAAFAGSLYVLARTHLHKQIDDRLEAALATLAAVVEIERRQVEWDPAERAITLGRDSGPEHVRWVVHSPAGNVVARSANSAGADWPAPAGVVASTRWEDAQHGAEVWRLARRTILPHEPRTPRPASEWNLPTEVVAALDAHFPAAAIFEAQKRARSGRTGWRLELACSGRELEVEIAADGRLLKYEIAEIDERNWVPGRAIKLSALTVTVGLSTAPVRDTLATLAGVLTGLSAGVWLAAALLGRLLCRRALAPVARMSAGAEAIRPDDLAARLPEPAGGDELAVLARSFNNLLTRVQVAFERQKRFTGDASHQLRTPLAVMAGQVDVALRRPRSVDEYRRVLELLRRRIGELEQIVESLLFLARADAEAQIGGLETVRARDLTAQAAARFAEHPRRADLSFESAPDAPAVRVHPRLFAQMLDNLIDNALKYGPPGTPVGVRAERCDASTAAIRVEDQGPGIPADEQPRIFEPFFRGAGAQSAGVPGTGLGLAVAERIARALGGSLQVADGAGGKGTRFTILLPAVAEPATAAAPVAAAVEPATVA